MTGRMINSIILNRQIDNQYYFISNVVSCLESNDGAFVLVWRSAPSPASPSQTFASSQTLTGTRSPSDDDFILDVRRFLCFFFAQARTQLKTKSDLSVLSSEFISRPLHTRHDSCLLCDDSALCYKQVGHYLSRYVR